MEADPTQSHIAPAPIPVENPFRRRRVVIAVAAFLAGLYAIFLCTHMGACAGGSDTSGYLNSAWLFGRGTTWLDQRTIRGLDASGFSRMLYIPLGFEAAPGGRMVPTYSTGLPLVVAAVARITGWNAAAPVTMFLFSLLGLMATALLAREWGLPWEWTAIAVLLIAASPLYLMHSLFLMSDVPAMAFSTATLALSWKSRARAAWAAAAGAAFAGAVLTRHTDALLLPALAVCLGLSWRRWLLFGLTGLPGGVFYCLYNRFNYGHLFETGYGGVGGLFAAHYVPGTLLHYALGLPQLLTPLVCLSAGLPFLARGEPRRVAALIAWIACLLGFYSFYSYTQETLGYLRFILPAFPALAVGSLLVLRAALDTQPAQKLRAWLMQTFRQKFPPLPALAWIIMIPAGMHLYHLTRTEPPIFRWLMLAFPPACAGAIHWLHSRFKADPAMASRITCMALLASLICICDLVRNARLLWIRIAQIEAAYPQACAWANETLPANAVIYTMQTSGALLYYTPFTLVRWDYVTLPQRDEIDRVCAASGRPVYALVFPFEVDTMRRNHFLDGWTQIAGSPSVTCWRLDEPAAATP